MTSALSKTVLGLLALLFSTPAYSQSLGEVAWRESERKAKQPHEVIEAYAKRWTIEPMFHLAKHNWGWNEAWQQSRQQYIDGFTSSGQDMLCRRFLRSRVTTR